MTTHTWPLSIVKEGFRIQFASNPIPWRPPKPIIFQPKEQLAVDSAVKKFLNTEVIEIAPDQTDTHFLSQFFTVNEPNKIRPILDCRRINNFVQCEHFKMEGVPTLREMIQKGDFLTKIDLKDAYVVVPIHQKSRRFLSFLHRGTLYRYKSLAFGLSVAPRVFSKLMRHAIEPLRKEGIRMVYYLDDLCFLTRTEEETAQVTKRAISHLQNLGFIINWEKSKLDPSHHQEFLGFEFNTLDMKIKVPMKKLSNLHQRIQQIQRSNYRSCRWVAALLGKMTAMIPAIGEALLRIRFLQRDLANNLRLHRQNWERPCPLSQQGLQDLEWWVRMATTRNGLPIVPPLRKEPNMEIWVDASDTGWGVHSSMVDTAGYWNRQEREDSINVRELKTILFALQLHGPRNPGSVMLIHTDNTTALKYARRSGGTASAILQQLALDIQEVCNTFNLQVSFQHIAGAKNVEADALSREKRDGRDYPSMRLRQGQTKGSRCIGLSGWIQVQQQPMLLCKGGPRRDYFCIHHGN
ncbi:hypothetical protein G6F43_012859 [Rhizopus delemar]|nr:hypothetical protein G6F43_012859 [Rhizopus delemar]